MKQIFSLVIILSLQLGVYAQSDLSKSIRTHKKFTKQTLEQFNARNIESTKQSLDSLISYDAETPMYKIKFTYTESGLDLSEKDYSYDDEVGDLVMNYSLDYAYDENNRLEELLVYEAMHGDPYAHEYFKQNYTYTEDGRLLQELMFYYDDTEDLWVLSNKNEYTYNDAGYDRINSSWSESETWEYSSKDSYILNDMEDVIEKISYYWNSDSSVWYFTNRQTYNYNEAGKLVISLSYYWDYELDDWLQSGYRNTYTYNDSNLLLTGKGEEYDGEMDEWVTYYQTEYFYDDLNNVAYLISSNTYESESGTLEPSGKSVYTYNNDFTYNNLLIPEEIGEEDVNFFNHMLLTADYYEWNAETETWESGEESFVLYYSPREIVGTNTITSNSLNIYPNPFTTNLTFDVSENSTLELFNTQGQRVYQTVVSKQTVFSTEDLVSGVYLYKLKTVDKTYTGKVIKK